MNPFGNPQKLMKQLQQAQERMQREIAEFVRAEAALVFNTGYVTNLATVAAIERALDSRRILDRNCLGGSNCGGGRGGGLHDLFRCHTYLAPHLNMLRIFCAHYATSESCGTGGV